MENPVVGGYTPEKVALRRAIALAVDIGSEIRNVRRNQAIAGQSPIPPGNSGYDPAFRSEMSEFNRAKAKALLDLYGYVDRDGDGWREQPDGSPLVIEYATQPDDLEPPAHHRVEEEHGRDRRAHGLSHCQMAGEPEGVAGGQADDVGRRLERAAPTATNFLSSAMDRAAANRIMRAFSSRNSTVSTICSGGCPTGPSGSPW